MAEKIELAKQSSLGIGIVGTGFAAQRRAAAFQADARSQLIAVTSHSPDSAQAFAEPYDITVSPTVEALVHHPEVDVVVVCSINCDHGAAVRAALTAGKAAVVEYPLSLAASEAAELIELAHRQNQLLHVEHIELLGGLHQAMQAHLPQIGTPKYVRYATAVPQNPAPEKWTYHRDRFGFPLMAALSRVHRLTNLFGAVKQVTCRLQYDGSPAAPTNEYFRQCRCVATLQFHSGVVGEVLYAKGEETWRSQRWMEVEGDAGGLYFDGDQGKLVTVDGETVIEVGSRRGLFAKDSALVLDALLNGASLYVTPAESLYALQVAAAAQASAQSGQPVAIEAPYPKT